MGIYIKSMEMPASCRDCPFEMYFTNTGVTRCQLTNKMLANAYLAIPFDGRDPDCPIADAGKHGRLIDSDELLKVFDESYNDSTWWFSNRVDDAPTIIDADY